MTLETSFETRRVKVEFPASLSSKRPFLQVGAADTERGSCAGSLENGALMVTGSFESVFLVGLFAPDQLGHSYEQAFRSLGLHTFHADLDETRDRLSWVLRNRIACRVTLKSLAVRSRGVKEFNQWLEGEITRSGAQAILSLSLQLILPETYRNLRRAGKTVAAFYPDNPFPPHYAAQPEALPAARETNLCFIWSQRLAANLRNVGIPGEYLPFAWDHEVFPYIGDQPQGTWPGVLFLGGWDREREAFLEEIAHAVPLRIYGPSYWGTRTKPFSKVRSCWQGTDLRMREAARVIRESAVCLNVLRTQHVIDGSPDGTIMRHFEVPGAGGFLLSTRSGGAPEILPEGKAAEYFSDSKECIEKAKEFIADETRRRQIAERGHEIVTARHQYTNRARQILTMLEQLGDSKQMNS